MERERETCAHFDECSFFFLLFFVRHTGKRALFLVCGSPSHSKKFSCFLCLFLSLFSLFLPLCLFYFLISPIKKIITRRRRKDLFSSSSFFFFVCVFSCLSQQSNTRRGSQNIFAQKRKRPPLFSLDSHKKHRKRSALVKTSRVLLSPVFRYKKLYTHHLRCVHIIITSTSS